MVTIEEIRKLGGKTPPPNKIKITYRKMSFYFTWILIKLNMSANQVSLSGMILGIFGAVLYATGDYLLFIPASLLYFYSRMADYADGNVARYRKNKNLPDERFRQHGGFFDWMNHIAPPAIFLCMSIGFAQTSDRPLIILSIGLLSAFFIFFDNGLLKLAQALMKKKIHRRGSRIARFLRATIISGLLIPFYFLGSSIIDLFFDLNATFYVWLFITAAMMSFFFLELGSKKDSKKGGNQ